jgi:hypothetical protein
MTEFRSATQARVKALKALDDGVPSTLPDSNPFKRAVEQHRWGNRTNAHKQSCPACKREREAEENLAPFSGY